QRRQIFPLDDRAADPGAGDGRSHHGESAETARRDSGVLVPQVAWTHDLRAGRVPSGLANVRYAPGGTFRRAALAGERSAPRPCASLRADFRGAAVGLAIRFGLGVAAAVLVRPVPGSEPDRRPGLGDQGPRQEHPLLAFLDAG